MTWRPGTQILWVYRGFLHGVDDVRPMTVVRDDGAGLVAWLAPGTPTIAPRHAGGRSLREAGLAELFRGPKKPGPHIWGGNGILKVAPTGRPWSVWHSWDDAGAFAGWYVHLERPHTRDERHTYTEDYVLDVAVSPAREVRRRDEDKLAAALEAGKYDAAKVAEIESYAKSAEQEIEAWGPPFCDAWPNWRPDPAWPLPAAPAMP